MESAVLLLAFTGGHEPMSGHDIYDEMDGPALGSNDIEDDIKVHIWGAIKGCFEILFITP